MITIHGWEVKPTLFPDNTCQVWKLPEWLLECETVHVYWDFCSMTEFFELPRHTTHIVRLKFLITSTDKEYICI